METEKGKDVAGSHRTKKYGDRWVIEQMKFQATMPLATGRLIFLAKRKFIIQQENEKRMQSLLQG